MVRSVCLDEVNCYLVCSVDIMKKKVDSENLGIILLNAFMDEFFPKEESSTPDTFQLVHYNGLPQSNCGGHVSLNDIQYSLPEEATKKQIFGKRFYSKIY